ncbi:MAG: LysR family transcriptional regulator [Acidobacteriota bacterium]
MGPGKADLLDAIQRGGSLRAAAEGLGMSYMRAWKLVQTMNQAFRSPLVEMERGGAGRGHALLTAAGEEVLKIYRDMEKAAGSASAASFRKLRARIRE